MAEVLSQSQIDALLNSIQSDDGAGAEDKKRKTEKSYRKYDFYSPKKFTKEKLKMIKGIYDSYARIAASQLNSLLRANCDIEVLTVEEQRYYEFGNALTENDIMMLASLKLPDESKNPPMIFYMNQILMVNLIDRMLGGVGNDTDLDASYTYTEVEVALYKKIMQYLVGVLKDAWSNYIRIDIEAERLEETPSLFQEISQDEAVAIVILDVKMQNIEGKIHICIPGKLLSNIFMIIDKSKHIEGAYDNGLPEATEIITEKIKESALTVTAKLGKAEVSLDEICNLRVGDVVDLNKQKDSDVLLYVDQEPWFEGCLGVYKKNVAIRIERRLEDEVEVETSVE